MSTDSAGHHQQNGSILKQPMTVTGDPLGDTSMMSESVLLSSLQNQDRPFGWRESNKFTDTNIVKDYKVRYSSETNTMK